MSHSAYQLWKKHYGEFPPKGKVVHHRVPICMGGTDEKDNLELLTYEEHLNIHKELAEKTKHPFLIKVYRLMSNTALTTEEFIKFQKEAGKLGGKKAVETGQIKECIKASIPSRGIQGRKNVENGSLARARLKGHEKIRKICKLTRISDGFSIITKNLNKTLLDNPELGLSKTELYKIARGNRNRIQHKGWTMEYIGEVKRYNKGRTENIRNKNKNYGYEVTFPDGNKEVVKSLSKFSKENGLIDSTMYEVAKGKSYAHKGYKVRVVELPEHLRTKPLRIYKTYNHKLTKEERSIILKKAHNTPENKKRMSNLLRRLWSRPEFIENQIQTHSPYLYEVIFPDGKKEIAVSLKNFCKVNKLQDTGLYNVVHGKAKQHKGFKAKRLGLSYELEINYGK